MGEEIVSNAAADAPASAPTSTPEPASEAPAFRSLDDIAAEIQSRATDDSPSEIPPVGREDAPAAPAVPAPAAPAAPAVPAVPAPAPAPAEPPSSEVAQLTSLVSQLMESNRALMARSDQPSVPEKPVAPAEPEVPVWEKPASDHALASARAQLGADVSEYTLQRYADQVAAYHRWTPYLEGQHAETANAEIAKIRNNLQALSLEARREGELAELRRELAELKNGPAREREAVTLRERARGMFSPEHLASEQVGYPNLAKAMSAGTLNVDSLLENAPFDQGGEAVGLYLDSILAPMERVLAAQAKVVPPVPPASGDAPANPNMLPPPNVTGAAVAEPQFRSLAEITAEIKNRAS